MGLIAHAVSASPKARLASSRLIVATRPSATASTHIVAATGTGDGAETTKPKGAGRGRLSMDKLKPPVDSPGQWVLRKEFQGRKSFGAFQCVKCTKIWTSAHAYKNFKQGCQRCELEGLPVFMWVNKGKRDYYAVSDDEEKPPHDSERCEACRAGECDMARY